MIIFTGVRYLKNLTEVNDISSKKWSLDFYIKDFVIYSV